MRFDTVSPVVRDPLVRVLLILLVVIAALFLLERVWSFITQFQDLIVLFGLAWVISFLLEPAVAALDRVPRVPRTLSVLVVYLALLITLGAGMVLLVPVLVAQSEMAAERVPELASRLGMWAGGINTFLADRGISATDYTGELLGPVRSLGPWLVANAVTLAAGTASILFQTVLIVVLSLYLMLDGERLGRRLIQAAPARYRDDFAYFVGSFHRAFGGFLRGQVIQSLIFGVGVAVIMVGTGLPFVALVSVLAGISIFIPFLGPILGTVPPIVIALAVDPDRSLLVLALTVALNIVVVNVIAPKLMSQQIGLHPVLVLGAVVLGARLGGPWGALFGVPVAAVVVAMVSFYQLTVAERERRMVEMLGPGDSADGRSEAIEQPAASAAGEPL